MGQKQTKIDGSDHYTNDEYDVYYDGKQIKEATGSSFKYLGNYYSKDNFDVFYRNKLLKKADAKTFTIASNEAYDAYDKKYYYLNGVSKKR